MRARDIANGRYILATDGEPVLCPDLMTWGLWLEKSADRRVAVDKIGDVRISTIFLALDHQWGDGPPILWETMIFGGQFDQWQERYSTKAEALAGHLRLLARVAGGNLLTKGE
jgi:hypothetical protein